MINEWMFVREELTTTAPNHQKAGTKIDGWLMVTVARTVAGEVYLLSLSLSFSLSLALNLLRSSPASVPPSRLFLWPSRRLSRDLSLAHTPIHQSSTALSIRHCSCTLTVARERSFAVKVTFISHSPLTVIVSLYPFKCNLNTKIVNDNE